MVRSKKPFQPNPTKTCHGKNCYNSKTEAEIVKTEQELCDIKQELKLEIYRCSDCGQWHLTQL